MTAARSDGRQHGRIEERGDSLRVVYYAGQDPVTGKCSYLRETIKRTDKAAQKKANDKLAELRSKVAKQQPATSSVPFAEAVSQWLSTSEIMDSTRADYVNYIDRYINPVLSNEPTR